VRVAFLTHEPFHPPSGGGSAEAVYLVGEFVRRGHTVHLFCPDFPDAGSVAGQHGIAIHPFTRWQMGRYTRLRNLKYLLYPGALATQVRKTLRAQQRSRREDFQYDLLFAQHTISAVAAGRLRDRLGIPTALNFLDYLTGFMETWPQWVMPRPVVRALTRYELSLPRRHDVEAVLTVSTPLAERFAATGYPRERIRAIQYGYDAELFRPADGESSKLKAQSSNPVVVMHGSFDEHHLGTIARGAVKRVAAARPEVTFRFAGRETPALTRFVTDVRAAVPSVRIETTGFVPYAEVSRHLQSADLGIVPYEESNGTHCAFVAKAVEYLGCGLPVVSTPLENLSRHFADEPAIRFSRFDGASFAEAILALLSTSAGERQRLGLAASTRVARELDWRVVTANAVDFVEAALAKA
jgi:glycosyltransferase involved in cell wall biosynthesis